MLPISVPATFRIIAHRGASAYTPENTLAAFRLAHLLGVREVELDTQLTTDGVVVLCHDHTLERYGHGAHSVESMSSAELLALDMGAWFSPFHFGGEPMLTLADLFAHFGSHFVYHVEIKGEAPGLVAAVATLIAQHNLAEHTVVTSFHDEALAAMQQVAPHLRRGWLVEQIDEPLLARAQELKLFQICPAAAQLSTSSVQRARTVVPEVRAWGLSGTNRQVIQLIHQVINSNCDGMTINWPDWVSHVV